MDQTGPRARRNRPATGSPIPRLSTKARDAGWARKTFGALDRIACRGLKPDLTILLDIDAETSLERARARNAVETSNETRMDEQSIEFHRKVYAAYHELAAREPERMKVIPGDAPPGEIEQAVSELVSAYV